jgi:tetratricopeptide (TPR) repeat protein
LVKLDPDSALAEISRARTLAPSDGDIAMFSGFAEWFVGNMDGALRNLEAAHQLDPRSSRTTYNLGNLYLWLHRYPQASALVATGRTVFPDAPEFRQLELQLLLEQGNLDGIRSLAARDTMSDHDLGFVASSITGWMFAPLLDDASRRRVLRLGRDAFPDAALQRMAQVMVYAVQHDTAQMRQAAQGVVTELEPITKLVSPPPDPQRLATLGQALAYAGRNAEAIAVAARVLATPALARNVFSRRMCEQSVALIYAQVGERDKAIDILASLLERNDYPLTPAWLRVDPTLESLHGNPRFEQLIARQPPPNHPR